MFITYMRCEAHVEGDPPGFTIAYDYEHPTDLDCEVVTGCNESLWIVPNAIAYPRCEL